MRSRTLVITAAAAALLAFPTGVWAAGGFDDVPEGRHYTEPAAWLRETGISAGCDGNSFCPQAEITRGQMATFLHRASGKGSVAPSFNADKVDGKDASAFLPSNGKAKDADRLDGSDSGAFTRFTSFYRVFGFVTPTDEGGGVFSARGYCEPGDFAISSGYFEGPDQFVYASFGDGDHGYAFYEDTDPSDGADLYMVVQCVDVDGSGVSSSSVDAAELEELARAHR